MKKVYRVTGTFQSGHHTQAFSKEFVAENPDHAKELVYANFGSKHAVPRRLMKLTKVEEVPADQIADPVVRHAAGA